jgi:hypothetical protein
VDASFWFDIYLNFRTAVHSSSSEGDYLISDARAIAYAYFRVRSAEQHNLVWLYTTLRCMLTQT